MQPPTVASLVDYVIANRRGKVFYDSSPIAIADTFMDAIEDKCLLYSVDSKGKFNGVAHWRLSGNTMYVVNVLTTAPGVLRSFICYFIARFPGYKIEAHRHGRTKLTHYNTPKLVSKIQSLT